MISRPMAMAWSSVSAAIVDGAAELGVEVSAADLVRGHHLAGGGLHQRRAAQEHPAGAAHDHAVIAHGRNIGAARGAVAHHQRHLLDAHFRQHGLVAENPPRHVFVGEDFRLKLQLRAGGIADMNHRQVVFDGDVEAAHDLLHRMRIPGAAFDGGIPGVDHDLAARDDADAGDHAGARRFAVIGGIGGQGRQFEERRAGIEQLLDARPWGLLALLGEAVEVALRTYVARLVELASELRGQALVVGIARLEIFRRGADEGFED